MAIRGNVTTTAQAWRTLTSTQRAGWTSLGAMITRTDTLGETYTLTGFQAFMSVNRNLKTYGGSAVTDAPAYSPPANIVTATLTATAS